MMVLAVESSTYIAAIIAGAISITGIIVNRWYSKRQDTADAELKEAQAAEVYSKIARGLVDPLTDQVESLKDEIQAVRAKATERAMEDEKRIEELTERVEAIERWAHLLFAQVIEAGRTPITFEESVHLHDEG